MPCTLIRISTLRISTPINNLTVDCYGLHFVSALMIENITTTGVA